MLLIRIPEAETSPTANVAGACGLLFGITALAVAFILGGTYLRTRSQPQKPD